MSDRLLMSKVKYVSANNNISLDQYREQIGPFSTGTLWSSGSSRRTLLTANPPDTEKYVLMFWKKLTWNCGRVKEWFREIYLNDPMMNFQNCSNFSIYLHEFWLLWVWHIWRQKISMQEMNGFLEMGQTSLRHNSNY